MADDKLTTELAAIRNVLDGNNAGEWYEAGRRLLAAVDAVLALHKPEPYYQALMCSCRPKPEGRLTWPCPTAQAIIRALAGQEASGG